MNKKKRNKINGHDRRTTAGKEYGEAVFGKWSGMALS